MSDNPRVSIIIPTYNRAAFLRDSLRSIVDQQEPGCSFEVIVVDDGSTDDTKAVTAAAGQKVKYLAIPRSGQPSVARNAGLETARGELIAFQDSDDIWAPDKLAKQVPVFEDPAVHLSFGAVRDFSGDGAFKPSAVSSSTVHELSAAHSGDIFEQLLWQNFVVTPTVMVRRQALKAAGGFDTEYVTGRDYVLWVKIAAAGGAAYLPDVLAYIRKHDEHLSRGRDPLDILHNRIKAQQTLYAYFSDPTHRGAVARRLDALYTELEQQAKLDRATLANQDLLAAAQRSQSRVEQAKILGRMVRRTRHPRLLGGQAKRILRPSSGRR